MKLIVATLVLIQALALFPSRVAARCPTMSDEGTAFGDTKFNTVKSQMWHNDGLWWGAFSDSTTGIVFYTFPNNVATKGPVIDANINGIPDALWDGTNLFVAVWKSISLATLYKYSYDSGPKTHTLISGFPVNLPLSNGSTSAIVLDKDGTGKLWATDTGTQGGFSDGKEVGSKRSNHTKLLELRRPFRAASCGFVDRVCFSAAWQERSFTIVARARFAKDHQRRSRRT